jgi:hypothetical protein
MIFVWLVICVAFFMFSLFNSLPVFVSVGPFKDHMFPIIYTVPIGSLLVLPFLIPSLTFPMCGLLFKTLTPIY